jgi:hypothetical protein
MEDMAYEGEITSSELDEVIDEAETLSVGHPADGAAMRIYVGVDSETLHELQRRATETGTDLAAAASEALRAGAHAA